MNPYEMVIIEIGLSADEINVLKESLERYQETCASHVEELLIEGIMEKLE